MKDLLEILKPKIEHIKGGPKATIIGTSILIFAGYSWYKGISTDTNGLILFGIGILLLFLPDGVKKDE